MSTLTEGTNKNLKIQIIRAIAIICVVMIHTAKDGLIQVFIRPILNLSVGTFIFLSGYLTSFDIKDIKSFYIKRIIRVLIPYIIWVSLTAIVKGEYSKIPVYIITGNASAQFYYIPVYIQFVLLTPLLIKLIKSKYRWIGWVITPLSTVIFTYLPMMTGIALNKYVSVVWKDCCLGWFVYYYLGLMLGNKVIKPKYSNKSLIITYVITILIQTGEGYLFYLIQKTNPGTQIKLSAYLTTSVFILLVFNYLNNGKEINSNSWYIRLAILSGDCSFGIYLSHILVIMVLEHLVPFYKDIPFCLNSIVILAISTICVITGRKILGKKISRLVGLY